METCDLLTTVVPTKSDSDVIFCLARVVMSLGVIKSYANGRLTRASGHE